MCTSPQPTYTLSGDASHVIYSKTGVLETVNKQNVMSSQFIKCLRFTQRRWTFQCHDQTESRPDLAAADDAKKTGLSSNG